MFGARNRPGSQRVASGASNGMQHDVQVSVGVLRTEDRPRANSVETVQASGEEFGLTPRDCQESKTG